MTNSQDHFSNLDLPDRDNSISAMMSRRVAKWVVNKPLVLKNEQPIVTISFDDIPATAATNGAKILQAYGARGTFFVAGGLCGTDDRRNLWRHAGQDAIVELAREGHEIGCHTYSHHNVQSLDSSTLVAELDTNKAFLEGLDCSIQIENFAFPYGSCGFRQKRVLEERFKACRGSRPGIQFRRVDLGMVSSVELYDIDIDANTVRKLIDETVRHCGWLVFHTHDVKYAPTKFGCSPSLLEATLKSAELMGATVLSMRDALKAISRDPPLL